MPRPKQTLAAAAVLAFLVAGCSSDGDTEAGDTPLPTGTGRAPTSTASTTASPSGATTSTPSSTTGTSAPSTSTPSGSSSGAGTSTSVDTDATTSSGVNSNGLPPGLTTPEAKRAEAFLRRYLDTYNKAAQDPSMVAAMDSFALPSCVSCRNLRTGIAEMAAKKRHLTTGPVAVLKLITDNTDSKSVLKIYAVVRQKPVDVLNDKGEKVGRTKGDGDFKHAYDVRNTGGALKIEVVRKVVGDIE